VSVQTAPPPTRKFAFNRVSATDKIFSLRQRIRAVAGGTSASKTISILFWLMDYAYIKHERPKLISIVSESYPHLEGGAMRDFIAIMKDRNYWDESCWHKTKHIYTTPYGNEIQFMSMDTYGKAHGPRRDVLYVNECNNLEYKIVDQLITRTREVIWLDWNPSEEFWFYTEMQPNRDDIDFLTVTYKDNEALDAVTVAEIESHQHNKNWWQVYGLGKLGEVEGRIYTGWNCTLDEVPHEARLERRGLDFGYSQDPAAIVDIYYHNGGYILDERLYQKGMSNRKLGQFINNMDSPNTLVIADSAEPKSIDELLENGVGVVAANKGPGSVNQGINYVQDQRISVTKRSIHLIREYRKYMWQTDKNGTILNAPEDGNDHCLDALRYAMESLRPNEVDDNDYDDTPFDNEGFLR
jgi:phage terminase large subunit